MDNMYIVISKINNFAKVISAIDKDHAVNKAIRFFPDHSIKDLKVLKNLGDAKKG
jgi:hypothetical protein